MVEQTHDVAWFRRGLQEALEDFLTTTEAMRGVRPHLVDSYEDFLPSALLEPCPRAVGG
jgi:hypothetical protein